MSYRVKILGAIILFAALFILYGNHAYCTQSGDQTGDEIHDTQSNVEEITAGEIAKRVEARKKPKDQTADMTMILTSSSGKKRIMKLRSVSAYDNKRQIMWFLSPNDDRGVAFLKLEYDNKPDEMRLWLPAFKKTRRISSSKKGDAFMGSDISYEDMTTRSVSEYEYKLLGREMVGDEECYILESIPHPEAGSSYSKLITRITVNDFRPISEETYDRAGRHYKDRTIEYQQIGDYIVPVRIFVKNVQKNHTTQLIFDNIRVDTGVDDNIFSEKNLKRLPM